MAEVGVSIVTYNHEKVICKCIDSFLVQKVEFEYEITIFDDCSIDRTIETIKERYGECVKYHLNDRNMGIGRNMFDALSTGSYKYKVLFAGDDWLLDDYCLQAMYDHLEAHKKDAAVGVWARVFNKDEEYIGEVSPKCNFYTLRPFLCGQQITADPTMFRNIYDAEKDKWIYRINSESNEPQMLLSILLKGRLGVLHKYVRAYRYVKDDKFDNYNSTHTALDTYALFRKVFFMIESKIGMKGLFCYKLLPLTSNVIKIALVKMLKKFDVSDMKAVLGMISCREFAVGFLHMLIFGLRNKPYSRRMFRRMMKVHKRKYDLSKIGGRLC